MDHHRIYLAAAKFGVKLESAKAITQLGQLEIEQMIHSSFRYLYFSLFLSATVLAQSALRRSWEPSDPSDHDSYHEEVWLDSNGNRVSDAAAATIQQREVAARRQAVDAEARKLIDGGRVVQPADIFTGSDAGEVYTRPGYEDALGREIPSEVGAAAVRLQKENVEAARLAKIRAEADRLTRDGVKVEKHDFFMGAVSGEIDLRPGFRGSDRKEVSAEVASELTRRKLASDAQAREASIVAEADRILSCKKALAAARRDSSWDD